MISPPYPIIIRDQQLWLSHERCIFWEDQKTLIISDTHFGKTGHFRKEGIGLPQGIYNEDLKRFISLIHYFNPNELVVIGDMFHSHHNKEVDQFVKLRKEIIDIPIKLIQGNHDLLPLSKYEDMRVTCLGPLLIMPPFAFTHDIGTGNQSSDLFYFSGHIHPGVQIKSHAKQRIQLPCFYFNDRFSYLPAFSRFTGMHKIKASTHDAIFMITNNKVIPIT